MNKRHWFFDIVVLVVVGAIALYVYLGGVNLRTQLLGSSPSPSGSTTVDDCSKLAEDPANDCYMALAVSKKDKSACDQITKSEKKRSCQREVELTP